MLFCESEAEPLPGRDRTPALLRGNQCEPVRRGVLNRRPPVSERKVLPLRPGLPEISIERAARLS